MSPPMSLGFHHPTTAPVFGYLPAPLEAASFLHDVHPDVSDALFGFVYDPLDHAANAALDDILRIPSSADRRPVVEEQGGATAGLHCDKKLRACRSGDVVTSLPRYGVGNHELPALPEFRTKFALPLPMPPTPAPWTRQLLPHRVAFARGSDDATVAGGKSVQSVAAKERRKRITQKTAELSRLIPGAQKMSTAEMLEEGTRHVKLLQAQIGMLTLLRTTGEKDKMPIKAQEQMHDLLVSGRVQERLAAEGKCLVPRKLVDAMAKDKDVMSNPLVNRDLVRFMATLKK